MCARVYVRVCACVCARALSLHNLAHAHAQTHLLWRPRSILIHLPPSLPPPFLSFTLTVGRWEETLLLNASGFNGGGGGGEEEGHRFSPRYQSVAHGSARLGVVLFTDSTWRISEASCNDRPACLPAPGSDLDLNHRLLPK